MKGKGVEFCSVLYPTLLCYSIHLVINPFPRKSCLRESAEYLGITKKNYSYSGIPKISSYRTISTEHHLSKLSGEYAVLWQAEGYMITPEAFFSNM